ncbi:hypothetical protein C0992_006336, partial [Termitomyces sp. T32_za158]
MSAVTPYSESAQASGSTSAVSTPDDDVCKKKKMAKRRKPAPSAWPMTVPQGQFLYQPETLGNEFSVLSDFLETLDEGSFFTNPSVTINPASSSLLSPGTYSATQPVPQQPSFSVSSATTDDPIAPTSSTTQDPSRNETQEKSDAPLPETVLPSATKAE